MKSLLHSALLILLCTILCGCPYDSPYSIDEEPRQPVDEDLLGKWATFVPRPSYENDYTESPVKIIFDKRTDMEYNVAITGYIYDLKRYRVSENDTIKGTAFLSLIDNRYFLNTFIKGKVYIAEVRKLGNSLDIMTLAEHFTSKYVKNSVGLRNAIGYHYKSRSRPMYDDWFVLKNLQKVN